MSEFTEYLNTFVEMLDSLKTAAIPRHISVSFAFTLIFVII